MLTQRNQRRQKFDALLLYHELSIKQYSITLAGAAASVLHVYS
jgi:hypothetical protein